MQQEKPRVHAQRSMQEPVPVAELLQTCKFTFRTLDEAESLCAFTAQWFPDPGRVYPGLLALTTNAIEHGNIGLGFDEKAGLLAGGLWRDEIDRLQKTEEHRHKYAELTISRKDNGVYAVIADQGKGFDWKRYIRIDPARAGDNHGRGIALASSASFDKLAYNGAGNQVVAYAGFTDTLKW